MQRRKIAFEYENVCAMPQSTILCEEKMSGNRIQPNEMEKKGKKQQIFMKMMFENVCHKGKTLSRPMASNE